MTIAYMTSGSINNLDTVPVYRPTRGMGAPVGDGGWYEVSDYITTTASALGSVGTTMRLVRFPIDAMVQNVKIFSDQPLDTNNSPVLALDFNIAFSDANTATVGGGALQGAVGDSVNDGTPTYFAGQVPTSADTGAVTPVTTYTSPNIFFGTYTVQSHTVGIPWNTDITVPGATGLTVNANTIQQMQQPMWYNLGFVNQNLPITGVGGTTGTPGPSTGGFFDLMAYVSTAAATGAAEHLWAKVTYYLG